MLYIAFQNKAIIFGIKQSYSEPASKSVSNNLTVNQLQNQQCTSFRITITESNDMNNDVKTNAKSTCQNHISKSTRVRAETQKRVDLSNVDTFLCYVRIHFVDFCCAMFHVLCVFFWSLLCTRSAGLRNMTECRLCDFVLIYVLLISLLYDVLCEQVQLRFGMLWLRTGQESFQQKKCSDFFFLFFIL